MEKTFASFSYSKIQQLGIVYDTCTFGNRFPLRVIAAPFIKPPFTQPKIQGKNKNQKQHTHIIAQIENKDQKVLTTRHQFMNASDLQTKITTIAFNLSRTLLGFALVFLFAALYCLFIYILSFIFYILLTTTNNYNTLIIIKK